MTDSNGAAVSHGCGTFVEDIMKNTEIDNSLKSLLDVGVSKSVAQKLLENYSLQHIQNVVSRANYLKDSSKLSSAPNWIIAMLKKGITQFD